ncbi:MAG: cobalt-zinc-cadmium efflux system membrane fusion protein [Spirosomataceae bacterium]|jgi:cobalt-zinc-cadmium efflux system membrane fusion protein
MKDIRYKIGDMGIVYRKENVSLSLPKVVRMDHFDKLNVTLVFSLEEYKIYNQALIREVKKKSLLTFNLLTLFLLTFLTACQTPTEEATAEVAVQDENVKTITAAQYKNMGLEIGDVQSVELAETITVNGMVDVPPENVAMVSLPVMGFVKTLTHNVLPGKYVRKGSVLATAQSMEAVQLQQDYLEKFTQNDFLSKELERQKNLAAEDATAKRKLQEAESNYRVNNALLSAFSAKLRIMGIPLAKLQKGEITTTLPVLAPLSGYVKAVHIYTGSNFTPQDVLFELVSKQHLHVELKVFEKDAFKVKEGQTVVFNDPRIGGRVEGKIFLVGKVFEADTKAINIHVHLSNEAAEQRLIPGQFLSAAIQTDNRTASVLPESAISREDGNTFVYILDKQNAEAVSFKKIAVQTGTVQDGKVEILSPANLQNVVLTKVTFLAGMGGEEE